MIRLDQKLFQSHPQYKGRGVRKVDGGGRVGLRARRHSPRQGRALDTRTVTRGQGTRGPLTSRVVQQAGSYAEKRQRCIWIVDLTGMLLGPEDRDRPAPT